jgi:hypothetical protein
VSVLIQSNESDFSGNEALQLNIIINFSNTK